MICSALSPAAIRTRMNVFIRAAIGEVDMSSVVLQVGQTISASRSAWRGGLGGDGRAGERERGEDRREEPDHCAWPSAA